MNTRSKILTPAAVSTLQPAPPVLLVTGRFEILRAELVRELAEARRRTRAQTLIAVVRPVNGERVPLAARAELAAALRVIDYVLILENEDLYSLAATFQPIEIVHLEEADMRRTRQLIEHVHRRENDRRLAGQHQIDAIGKNPLAYARGSDWVRPIRAATVRESVSARSSRRKCVSNA